MCIRDSSYRNPFSRIEAESFSEKYGNIQIEDGDHLGWVEAGNWVKYTGVDFGTGADTFRISLAMQYGTPSVEIRLDSIESETIATVQPNEATGAWDAYRVFECGLPDVTGAHDVYLYFPGANVNVDLSLIHISMRWTAESCCPCRCRRTVRTRLPCMATSPIRVRARCSWAATRCV